MELTLFEVDQHLIIGLVSETDVISLMFSLDELAHIVDYLLLSLCLGHTFCLLTVSSHQFLGADDTFHLLLCRFATFSSRPAHNFTFLASNRYHG